MDSLRTVLSGVLAIDGGYQFVLKTGTVKKIDLVTDTDGFLNKWRSYYRDKKDFGEGEVEVVTQMRYFDFSKSVDPNSKFFRSEEYVSIDKENQVTARGEYKEYYIINQLQTK